MAHTISGLKITDEDGDTLTVERDENPHYPILIVRDGPEEQASVYLDREDAKAWIEGVRP
ncbi:hypothetical protein LCGC14_2314660 [marine sediment metagenome]|uniref:Uncharacterized protein n=1 Tax=marine sediment metagenome TaxID=412755 RepID=A0A0F9CK60_9ZZZZ